MRGFAPFELTGPLVLQLSLSSVLLRSVSAFSLIDWLRRPLINGSSFENQET